MRFFPSFTFGPKLERTITIGFDLEQYISIDLYSFFECSICILYSRFICISHCSISILDPMRISVFYTYFILNCIEMFIVSVLILDLIEFQIHSVKCVWWMIHTYNKNKICLSQCTVSCIYYVITVSDGQSHLWLWHWIGPLCFRIV